MSKEITKSYILQEIQDKFKLRDLIPSKFVFEETVMPVYSIEEHLVTNEAKAATKPISTIGGREFFLVPDDERWFLNGYTVVVVTGTYTFAGVYITRKAAPSYFLYLDLTAAQTLSYAHFLPRKLTLSPGDIVGINIDGYTASGNLAMYIDYGKETIR